MAFGNLIVVIVAKARLVDNQVYEYCLFAGLLSIATLVFSVLSFFYKYNNRRDEPSKSDSDESTLNDEEDHHREPLLNSPI